MTTIRFGFWAASLGGLLVLAGCKSNDAKVASNAGKKLVLVKNGESLAPIVVFKDAPLFTRQAADELAETIEKISGAKPQVIEGTPNPIPKHAIWVGYQPILKKLFPKLDFDFNNPEEILIAANDDHLVIAGRDRWDPDNLTIKTSRGDVDGRQTEYGTANAVYTFLQDFLDVRWLWPGELGEDIVKEKTIAFAPFVFRYHPQFRARGGIFAYSRLGGGGYGRSQDWTRKQRLRLDSLTWAGGHAFITWWERFHEDHPEFFALQPDGTRSGYPSTHNVKICQSNPDVWDVWLNEDVTEHLRKDPNQTVFSCSPNDGWASGHCVCDNCLAWDHPDGKARTYHWEGLGQEHVALSDRLVTFGNQLARKLKERFPDKNYDVMYAAYGNTRPAPVEAKPDENTLVLSAANFLMDKPDKEDRGSLCGETHKQQFADWAKLAPRIIWRPNTGSPCGWQQGQPDVPIHQTIETMRFMGDNHCVGMFVDMVWEHWATCGPLYYILAQMAWNPRADGDAILDDYYDRAFGPAAPELKEYWTLMEDARNEHTLDDVPYADVYDEDFFADAEELLNEATAKLADAPEKYRDRVRFVRAGLDHTRWMIENRVLMKQYKESGNEDQAIADKVRANWEKIQKNCEAFPMAVNWAPIRPFTPRIRKAGLHPDYLTMRKGRAKDSEADKKKPMKKKKPKVNDLI